MNPTKSTVIVIHPFILPSLLLSSLQEYQGLVTYKLYKGVEMLGKTPLNRNNENTLMSVEIY